MRTLHTSIKDEREKNGKGGFINRNGKEIVKCKYDGAEDCSDGLAMVWKNGYLYADEGYVNKDGIEVIKCEYDMLSSFSNGMVIGKKNGKCYILSFEYWMKSNEERDCTKSEEMTLMAIPTRIEKTLVGVFDIISAGELEKVYENINSTI